MKIQVKILKENKDGKKEVGEMMKKIEARDGVEYETWQKTREWSIAGFDAIYRELNVKFSDIFYENQFVNQGQMIVNELFEKGILVKSDGAVIADLEKYGLGIFSFSKVSRI